MFFLLLGALLLLFGRLWSRSATESGRPLHPGMRSADVRHGSARGRVLLGGQASRPVELDHPAGDTRTRVRPRPAERPDPTDLPPLAQEHRMPNVGSLADLPGQYERGVSDGEFQRAC